MNLKNFLKLNEIKKEKFLGSNITKDSITLYTKLGSVCELSRLDILAENIYKTYKIKLKPPIFYFNRIKARKEGIGEGSLLMKKLIEILDNKKISVVNELNPYGKLNMNALEKFYSKFGFKKIEKGLMIREPK